jgi:hypothetical protein
MHYVHINLPREASVDNDLLGLNVVSHQMLYPVSKMLDVMFIRSLCLRHFPLIAYSLYDLMLHT